MIRAILFDLGGTLDGEQHWLERFLAFYAELGLRLPREIIRTAFDEAERRSLADEAMNDASFEPMLRQHVRWQLAKLQLLEVNLEEQLCARFLASVRAAAAANREMLSELAARGLRLGVVSNGCGNVAALCRDLGYTPFLSAIVDSRRVGLFKPDPAIFRHAANAIGEKPEHILMVGDSFARDIRPAKKIGLQTAWLSADGECPEATLMDFRLHTLAELPAVLSEASCALV